MATIANICFGLMLIVSCSFATHELIDDQYKPLYRINDGSLGTTYGGIRIRDDLKISIRFVDMKYKAQTDREYEIYTQLNAIGENSGVERFGFPKIFYYNELDGKMVTVYSYFGSGNLADKEHQWFRETQEINSLILFRDFVRQSKYMAAHGIRHNNISPQNIMLSGYQSFLINFNYGSNMNASIRSDNWKYWPRRLHKTKSSKNTHMDEWESFLYTMCWIHDVKLGWFFLNSEDLSNSEAFGVAGRMKELTDVTIAKIKTAIKSIAIQKVFLAFANEAFSNKTGSYPDYDRMDDLIMEEIKTFANPSKAMFTWINFSEKVSSEAKLAQTPLFNIRNDIKFNDVKHSKASPSPKHVTKSGSVKKGSKISKT